MSRFFLAISIIIRIIAVFVLVAPPALIGRMPIYLADLTLDFDKRCRGAVLATATITPAIAIITTTARAIIIATATRGAVVIAAVATVIIAERAAVISAARAAVIITAVAITTATWGAVIIVGAATGTRAATSTASNIHGGGESITGVLQHAVALIMGEQLVIEAIGSKAGLAIGRGHDIIVGAIKAVEDVVDELARVDGLAKRNELGAKTLHLGKVLHHGEGVLLGGIQGTTECVDLGW
jgi:hypothetical protein